MEENTRENKMGTMPIGKLLANMAGPVMISMLFQALYNIVDSVFVARLSQDAMNAVSLAFPLQTLCIAFAVGTGVGMNALLARSLGEKNMQAVDRAAGTGLFLTLCTAAVFAVLGFSLATPFFRFQTENAQIIAYGSDYVMICIGGSLGLFLQIYGERLLQSTGRTDLSMISQIAGAVCNIVLDPILIFGLLGFPRMEVAGAAVATIVGQFVGAGLGLFLNLKKNPEVQIHLKDIRPHRATVADIYAIGIPSIIMQSIGSVMVFGMNKILISFTEAATAVFGAYFKLQSFIFMPIFGLNNAMVPIISYNYGAGKPERFRRTIRLSAVTAIAIMCVGLAFFEIIPGTLLGLFSPSEEMLTIGRTALRIIGLTFPLAGFCIVSGSVFQALGTPFYSLIVSVCRQICVLLPVAYLLSLTGRLELVWWSFPIAELVSLTLSAIFLRRTLRAAGERLSQN
jgi:putative MATE family efflux protein